MRAKPIQLHRLQGTFRQDRHGDKLEVPPGQPRPFFELTEQQQKVWDELVPPLVELQIVAVMDSAALTRLVIMIASFENAKSVDMQVKLSAAIDRLGAQFGLTPDSRGKLKLPELRSMTASNKNGRFFDPNQDAKPKLRIAP